MSRSLRRRYCSYSNLPENSIAETCENVPNNLFSEQNECECGFDDDDNTFPLMPELAQSYVPIQTLKKTFTPEVGLKMGTIFPELVSPYNPNQSIAEINYIKENNEIKGECNDE